MCDAPYRHGFAGASALLGVDGTNHGHPERIAASFDIIDALTGRHGLVASERVGGTRLARFNY